jgi:hypothetical protein
MREAVHIYGIIESEGPKNFGPIGLGHRGNQVYTVRHRDLSAVVSQAPMIPFEALPKEVLLGHLTTHQFVIEQVMKSFTILPMKFGTMVHSEKEVGDILEAGYSQLKAALREKRCKIEFEVMALWRHLDSILQEIGQELEIRKFKEKAAQQPADQLRENQIALGKMVKGLLDIRRERTAAEILKVLMNQSKDLRFHNLMDDTMILNVALLVDRDRERELDRKIRELNERYQEQINFRCIGPLPPYSFSTVEVEKIGVDVLDEARKALELDEAATVSQIKAAHRRLMRVYHPDRHRSDPQAEERFKLVEQAYKVLTECCPNHGYSFRPEDIKDQIVVKIRPI